MGASPTAGMHALQVGLAPSKTRSQAVDSGYVAEAMANATSSLPGLALAPVAGSMEVMVLSPAIGICCPMGGPTCVHNATRKSFRHSCMLLQEPSDNARQSDPPGCCCRL